VNRFLPIFLLVFVVYAAPPVLAQKKNEAFQVHIQQTTLPISIDGAIDEPAWQTAEMVSDFKMVLPMDTSRANIRTEVRLAYDQQNFYISAVCFYTQPGKPASGPNMVESMRRDWNFGKNDNFIFFLDTFDDQTNGFAFGTNAAGAQWDGIIFDGGNVNLSWDNKWTSVVKNYADRYVFEAAIPFKSIRYKKGINRWGVNFSRLDLKSTEKSAWTPVPRQFPTASLAYTGNLLWDVAPPVPSANISLIPYVLGGTSQNVQNNQPSTFRRDVGFDAKVAITSALNLDLTVNPDFSQVDVDQQVTNLDRFELFFPERRQFFLENSDLFGGFGYQSIRPFFSRRIGLNAPIQFGVRLSGKLNKDWRIGLMDMQTGSTDALPGQNFAVMSLQRRVFARSNVRFLAVNKESLNYTPPADGSGYTRYNRNIGLEYNLASVNNLWTGKAMFLKSFSPVGASGRDWSHAANIQYYDRKWQIGWQHEYVGSNYTAEVGYVPRRGYIRVNPQLAYTFLFKRGKILSYTPFLNSMYVFNEAGTQTDNETFLANQFTLRSRATFTAWIAHDYVKLLNAFDPTNLTGDTLARGTNHSWNAWGTEFVSKPQSVFTYGFSSRYGTYFADGTRLALTGTVGYRFQPYVGISVNASYNDLRLPAPWNQRTFWLISPRLDVTMTNKLYLTTFLQYNEQAKNVNLNARLQWRYKPASDLFIVYTDNYLPGSLLLKNRALVLKFTYWWNV
jgi:Domain of unknown function (DUF5916)/Carbohydrate family 9 binding domain-like